MEKEKRLSQLLVRFWIEQKKNPITANSALLYIYLLDDSIGFKPIIYTDKMLTSILGITERALEIAQDELRERNLLQFRTTSNDDLKERDWMREYTMDVSKFKEFDERVESQMTEEELEIHKCKLEKLESDIQLIYDAYPTKCPFQETSTGKSSKDRERIKRHLKTKSADELLKIIKQYVRECLDRERYFKNFSTFLNNLPELVDESAPVVSKPSREGEEVDINVEFMTQAEKLDWFNDLRKKR